MTDILGHEILQQQRMYIIKTELLCLTVLIHNKIISEFKKLK